MNITNNHKKVILILSILIVIYLISTIHFTFNMDEEFTMGIIKYNYSKLIAVDSLDVHPPLYYLCLKLFLQIFTFWTQSIFIKVLFARLFSILIFLISFHGLLLIIKMLHIKVRENVILLFYLFVPSILSYSTTIRMYSLSSLFLIYEFYYIIKFNKYNRILYLLLLIIFASCASYTHYYAAVSAGLFIFILFIINSLNHDKNKAYKYLVGGIIFGIFYIPIIPFVMKQFSYESRSHSFNLSDFFHEIYSSFVGVTSSNGMFKFVFVTLLVFFSLTLIIWSRFHIIKTFNNYLLIIIYDYLLTLIIAFISGVTHGTPFMPRYMYADFSLYSFFVVIIFLNYLNKSKNKLFKGLILLISILFVFNICKSFVKNLNDYDIPSITLVKNFNAWKMNNSRFIKLNNYSQSNKPYGEPLYIFQSAIYLNSLHKKILVPVTSNKIKNNIKFSLLGGHKNEKLFRDTVHNGIIFKKVNKYN